MLQRLLIVCLVLIAHTLPAQTQLTRLSQYGELNNYSAPSNFFLYQDQLFFTATHDKTGTELWKTNGTAGGSAFVKDINLGPGSSIISNFVEFKGKFYFIATDGVYGYQLWQSDGTRDGTKRISSEFQFDTDELVATDDYIFFMKYSNSGVALWRSDGTQAGTLMVRDIEDVPYRQAHDLTVSMNKVYFAVRPNGESSVRIYRSDGTFDGTFPVSGLLAGSGGNAYNGPVAPSQFIAFNDALYFTSRDPSNFPVSIRKTDGTTSDPDWVDDIYDANDKGYADFDDALVLNGKMYFLLYNSERNYITIWSSDGIPGHAKQEYEYAGNAYFSASNMVALNGKLYFTTGDDSGNTTLVQLDPVSGNVLVVKSLGQVQRPPFFYSVYYASRMVAAQNKLYLARGSQYTSSYDLWVSDGTGPATTSLAKLNWGIAPVYMAVYKDKLFFNGVWNHQDELCLSDGTVGGTGLVEDLNPTKVGIDWDAKLMKTGNVAVFASYDLALGKELGKTDGTAAGTSILDLRPGISSSDPHELISAGNKVFFVATVEDYSSPKLLVTDGTAAGTKQVATNQLSGKAVYGVSAVDDTHFFFFTFNDNGSSSIYRCDVATLQVQELANLGAAVSNIPSSMKLARAATNGTLYFVTNTGELWKSDGTSTGTVNLEKFNSVVELAVGGGNVYLSDNVNFGGAVEKFILKRSNGKPGETIDLKVLDNDIIFHGLYAYGDKAVFVDRDNVNGRQVWITDGTAANTRVLKDVPEGNGDYTYRPEFATYSGALYFNAMSLQQGSELWKSDGTTAGTTIVSDILPGPGDSKPSSFVATGDLLYFTAYTPQTGFEVWSTDGATNTKMEMDVIPGETYSNPFGYMDLHGTLLFYATTGSSGVQLWSSVTVPAGIAEPGAGPTVYPNPSAGTFNVSLRNTQGASLVVFNAAGQRVHTQDATGELAQVNLGHLPAGLYVVQCTKGSKQYTAKVIKQ